MGNSFNPATPATPGPNFGAPPTPGPVYGDQPPATPGPVYNTGYSYGAPNTPNPTYGRSDNFRAPGSNQVAVKKMMPPDTPSADLIPQTPRSASDLGVGPPTLQNIAMHARNAEYNPKRFAAVIMRIREPRTTALIFSSGKMVCTGAKSEKESRLAARKYAR